MRKLLLGATMLSAAAAVSGCSFIAPGMSQDYRSYDRTSSHYGQHAHAQHAHARTVAPRGCGASDCLARWNLEGGVGPAFTVGGDVITGDRTNAGTGGNIRNVSWDTAYDEGYRAELGGSYALNPNRKITLMGHFENAEAADRFDWGTVDGQALTGSLSDYRSYGGELGLRQYFAPSRAPIVRSIRPYIEGRAGVSRVESIDIIAPELGGDAFAAGANAPFYEGSWVGTGAGLVGVETPLTRYSTIGLETGVRYQGGLKSDLTVTGPGAPLGGTNNADGRWSVPLMLRGRYRF